jgi:hypothetical protein
VKLTFAAGLFALASAAAYAQAPATSTQNSSSTQTPSTQSAQQTSKSGNAQQTVTGCLTQDDNIFTLTVMDDSGAPGTTVSTTAYTLAPGSGVDLKTYVNKRITVKGTDAGPEMQNSMRVAESSPATPAATGTSGTTSSNGNGSASAAAGSKSGSNAGATDKTPTVQTTSKARINARTLNVSDVQPAAGSCGAQ